MTKAVEVYVFIWYLGGPALALPAISIAALSALYQGHHLLHPWQPWHPRHRELVLSARFRVLMNLPVSPFALLRNIPGDGMDRGQAVVVLAVLRLGVR